MFDDDELPRVFELLDRVARAFAATVGPLGEAAVHDLRTPERSVVALYGDLTQRAVGAPVSGPDMSPSNVDRYREDALRHTVVTPFGRRLVSSCVWVRARSGRIVGALSLNVDFGELEASRDAIGRALAHLGGAAVEQPDAYASYARSTDEFVAIALAAALREIGKPPHGLARDERVEVIRALERAGVFDLRRSAEVVAGQLGISRGSVYAYLREVRNGDAAQRNGATNATNTDEEVA